jgi:Putative MetA-pathway of phenol degradation
MRKRSEDRTLVATGVLLLPFGQLEIEPAFTYTRRESDSSLPGPVPKFGRNELRPSISARAGLPFDSQLEFGFPYNVVQQDQHLNPSTGQQESRTETGHSVGDLSLGIAKTVFQERGWRPDLIARFTWDMPTGDTHDNGVSLDGGFNAITGQLTALKRQDPLAFFASTFYQKTFERNDFERGDEFGFSLGAFLAVSPETSLGLSLDQTFSDDTRVNGSVINDSDQVAAVLNVGVSSLLAPGVLLLLNAGIGLTDESPDYAVTISLPIRFALPGL